MTIFNYPDIPNISSNLMEGLTGDFTLIIDSFSLVLFPIIILVIVYVVFSAFKSKGQKFSFTFVGIPVLLISLAIMYFLEMDTFFEYLRITFGYITGNY